MKAWREKKRVEIAAYNKAYKEANKANLAESVRERSRRWYQENRQRALARDKAKYAANPDMKRANAAKSKAARRAKDEAIFKEKQAAYVRERRKGDARFALDGRMSNMVFYALRREKAGRSWKTLVDYTLDELVDRLNETMPDGYSWADFLSGELHIDHEIPRRAFNYTSPDDYDFKRCWALSNLRLLPREVNQKKGGRLSAPFQPSLL